MPDMVRHVWKETDYWWDVCSITEDGHNEMSL